METIYLNRENLRTWQEKAKPNVMAMGCFDGLHNGHCKVIQHGFREGEGTKCALSCDEFLSTSQNGNNERKKTNSLFNAVV